MVAPPKRRVPPGGRRPPPVLRPSHLSGRGHPSGAQVVGVARHGREPHRWSPADQVEHLGEEVRAWRRGGQQPSWVRAVGWTLVIALLGPLVLAAWQSLLR